jgi:ABC-type amino acid transport substrate-binding protein
LLLLAFFKAFANSRYTIYFYNPEININNFASLKSEFDKYLSDYGPFQFQPFSDRETFEKLIVGKNDGIFLLSSWHYRDLKRKFPIESVLVGVSGGKSTHRKILLTREDITSIDLLKGNTVASSGSEDYTNNILMQMLGENAKDIVDSLKILTVPKDIDALMAVGFGMANFALTTENSFAKLMTINPKQYEMQRQLAVSEEKLLPIVAVPKQPDDNIGLLLAIIEKMGMIPEGRKNLRMIGLDGWKKLDVAEMGLLE